jgi:hypothetical protein
MKKLVYLLIAASLMLALVPAVVSAHTEDVPFVTELIAGGGNQESEMDVGQVEVWNDGDYLYVKYVVDAEDWCLTETHLHVATSLEGIPQKNGNPPPGQFDYQMEHDCVTEYTYRIPLTWDPETDLSIAAHAVVCKEGAGGGEWILTTVTLWAGQTIDAGTVTVAIEGEDLVVTYQTTGGWELIETQLYVGTTPPGTAAPGQFPYKHSPIDPPVTTDQYTIPLSDFGVGCDDTLYLAAHATVQKLLDDGTYQTETGWGEGEQIDGGWAMYFSVTIPCECVPPEPVCETAWGAGFDFPGNNWATYFDYTVQYKDWYLPTDPVGLRIDRHPGTSNNYFDLELWNVGSGYDISDGVWTGWCADEHVYIYLNTNYTANVYSSLDPDLGTKCPYCVNDEQWDYVNYILNHKHPNASMDDIQQAIWYFTDLGYPMPTDPEAAAMVNDALAHGADFRPMPGDIGAVILAVRETVQLVFIEVDP